MFSMEERVWKKLVANCAICPMRLIYYFLDHLFVSINDRHWLLYEISLFSNATFFAKVSCRFT